MAIVAPVIACLIAAVGIARYHALEQSSWRGASFGMFASYEYDQARYVRVTMEDRSGRRQVDVPQDLADLRDEAATIPGSSAARRLGEVMRARLRADRVVVEIRGHDVAITQHDIAVVVRTIRSVVVP